MRSFTLLFLLLCTTSLSAQVAINHDGSSPASNTILHVKGSGQIPFVITDNDGKVGIGLTNPQRILDIATDANNGYDGYIGLRVFRNQSYGGGMHISHARGTKAAPVTLQKNDLLGYYSFLGYDGSDFKQGGNFRFYIDKDVSAGIIPTAYRIDLADDQGILRTRFVIRSDGNTGIGTTHPGAKLEVYDRFTDNAPQRGIYTRIDADPSSGANAIYTINEQYMNFNQSNNNPVSSVKGTLNTINLKGSGAVNTFYGTSNYLQIFNSRSVGNLTSTGNTVILRDHSNVSRLHGTYNGISVRDNATSDNIYGTVNAINLDSQSSGNNARLWTSYNYINIKGAGEYSTASGKMDIINHYNSDKLKRAYGSQQIISNKPGAGPVELIFGNYTDVTNESDSDINNLFVSLNRFTNRANGNINQNAFISHNIFVNDGGGEVPGILYGVYSLAENKQDGRINKFYGLKTTYLNSGSQARTNYAFGVYSELSNKSSEPVNLYSAASHHVVNESSGGDIAQVQLNENILAHQSSHTINTVFGVYSYVKNTGGGTINQIYGLRSGLDNQSGTVNHWYGLYINPMSENPNYYGIYVGNGNKSYFGGKVGVGTAQPQTEVDINGIMRLRPRATPPSSPTDGMIYMDDGTNTSDGNPKLRAYGNGTWHELW